MFVLRRTHREGDTVNIFLGSCYGVVRRAENPDVFNRAWKHFNSLMGVDKAVPDNFYALVQGEELNADSYHWLREGTDYKILYGPGIVFENL